MRHSRTPSATNRISFHDIQDNLQERYCLASVVVPTRKKDNICVRTCPLKTSCSCVRTVVVQYYYFPVLRECCSRSSRCPRRCVLGGRENESVEESFPGGTSCCVALRTQPRLISNDTNLPIRTTTRPTFEEHDFFH